jgi:hypothetical protein
MGKVGMMIMVTDVMGERLLAEHIIFLDLQQCIQVKVPL